MVIVEFKNYKTNGLHETLKEQLDGGVEKIVDDNAFYLFNAKAEFDFEDEFLGIKLHTSDKVQELQPKQCLVDVIVDMYLKINNLLDVAKIENVDIENLPRLLSNIPQLDNVVGFYSGQITIITGKTGEGKSTFVGQLMLEILAQGKKVMCYSGELSEDVFKFWINKINKSEFTKENMFYLFDNKSLFKDENIKSFIEVIKSIKVACNMGCKAIIVDNLMTLEDDFNMNLNELQKKIIIALKYLSFTYNIHIFLVSHPRKGNVDSTDSVSGSQNIVNLCDNLLVIRRYDSKDEIPDILDKDSTNSINILKNRFGGVRNYLVPLRYDEDSKRLFNPNKTYFIPKQEQADFYRKEEKE